MNSSILLPQILGYYPNLGFQVIDGWSELGPSLGEMAAIRRLDTGMKVSS